MRSVWFLVAGLVVAGGLAIGVGPEPTPASADVQSASDVERPLPQSSNPHADMGVHPTTKASPSEGRDVAGTVREVVQVQRYTYLRLELSGGGETWAAVPTSTPAVGSRVLVNDAIELQNFESPSLSRTFDRIFFGTLAGAGEEAPTANPHGASAPANPHGANPHAANPPANPHGASQPTNPRPANR